ncbi:MAG: hypothetical protein ACKOVB_03565 [Terrabacter sp.]
MFGDTDARREDLEDVEPVEPVGDLDGEPAAEDDLAGGGRDAADAHPAPPVTGDDAVDEAMMRLARSQAGSFAERIESGEHAHRSLQSRLGGLGGA